MRWWVYDTQAQAQEADAAVSAAMGLPRAGVNAATGEVQPDVVTERWAVPRQIADGRWVIQSPDESGEEAQPGWWPEEVAP